MSRPISLRLIEGGRDTSGVLGFEPMGEGRSLDLRFTIRRRRTLPRHVGLRAGLMAGMLGAALAMPFLTRGLL